MSLIGNAIKNLQNFFKRQKAQFGYDFLKEAEKSFPNEANKNTAALRWFKEARQDKDLQYGGRKPLKSGRLYWFKYLDPLTKETLEYWDMEPLVIVSSTFTTVNGQTRQYGINLHHLPPKIRVIVMAKIFEMHQQQFKKGLYSKKKQPVFEFSLKVIAQMLGEYGVGFAIRMYAPSQIKSAIEFRTEDWTKAVYIPSRRYYGTNQIRLRKEWEKYRATNR